MVHRPVTSAAGDEVLMLSADVTMQVQIYRQLKAEIEDGLWFQRPDFPGERDLAERFGVSVITSRAALERLAREDLISRGRGRRSKAVFEPQLGHAEPVELFPAEDTHLDFELVSHGVDTAPAAACAAFEMPLGSEMWQAVRIVRLGGQVHSVTHNVQRPEIGLGHSVDDLSKWPMTSILRRATDVVRIRRIVQATTPPPIAAHHLGLTLEHPALMALMISETEDGTPIEWMRSFSHPSRVLGEEIRELEDERWQLRLPHPQVNNIVT